MIIIIISWAKTTVSAKQGFTFPAPLRTSQGRLLQPLQVAVDVCIIVAGHQTVCFSVATQLRRKPGVRKLWVVTASLSFIKVCGKEK